MAPHPVGWASQVARVARHTRDITRDTTLPVPLVTPVVRGALQNCVDRVIGVALTPMTQAIH